MITTLFSLIIVAAIFFCGSFFLSEIWRFYILTVYLLSAVWLYFIHWLNKEYIYALLKQYPNIFDEEEKNFILSNASMICILAKVRTIVAIAEYRAAFVWTILIAGSGFVYYVVIKDYFLALFLMGAVLVVVLTDIKSVFPYAEQNFNTLQATKNYNKQIRARSLSKIDQSQAHELFESAFRKLRSLAAAQQP